MYARGVLTAKDLCITCWHAAQARAEGPAKRFVRRRLNHISKQTLAKHANGQAAVPAGRHRRAK
eukprot:1444302-Alexandrium_andersonii.AAC.1